jgi:PAS domain S-box-containing protein
LREGRVRNSPPFTADITFHPGDIVFATDVRGRIIYWNEEAERVLGYPADDVVGVPLDTICPLRRGEVRIEIAAVLAGEEFAGGVECRSRTGASLALYVYATSGRSDSGKTDVVVFVARDVSQFWRAEEAVRQSEEKYRLLFDNSSDAVMIAATDGRVLEVNRAAVRMTGYSVGELRRMALLDIVPPELRRDVQLAMAALLQTGAVTTVLELTTRGGQVTIGEVSASVVTVAGEQRILAIARDVTARTRAEKSVRQSELRYRKIFETVSDGVLLESTDGQILDVNENACKLLGYTKPELLRKKVGNLVPPEAKTWLLGVTDAILKHGGFRAETVYACKDGTHVPVELAATLIELDEGPAVLAMVRDITERRRTQDALRDSEERYRTVFETTGTATIIIEEDTTVPLLNREFEKLTGYARDEVAGRSWTEFVHKDDLDRMKEYHRVRRIDAARAPRNYEFRLINKSGAVRDCFLTIDLIPGTKKSVASFVDVTERNRAGRALAESEERYRTLFNDAPIGIYRTTPDGRVLMANPALLAMLGVRSFPEAAARNLEKTGYYGPTYPRSQFKERIERDGEVRGLEAEWVRADGATICVRENARVVRDPAGAVLYYEGTVEDITERKRTVEALEESEENFRALADNASDGIMIAAGGEGGIVYANRRSAEILGYGDEELRRLNCLALVHPDQRTLLAARYRQRLAGEPAPARYETVLSRRDRAAVPVDIAAARTKWHGQPASLVVIRDISERRRAEQALQEAEREHLTALDAMHDAVHVVDAGLRILVANKELGRWLRDLGLDPDVVGKTLLQAFPFLSDEASDEYRKVFETHGALVTEEKYVIGGREAFAEVSKTPVLEGGKVVRVITVVRDVTERGRMLAALAASESRYRTLVESVQDGVYYLDAEGRFTFVNDAIVRRSGRPRGWWLGRDHVSVVRPEDRERVQLMFRAVMRGESVAPYEAGYPPATGEMLFVEFSAAPLVESGKVVGLMGISRDITARKRAEKRIQETEEQYRRLVELSPDGIAVHQDGRIMMVNPAGASTLGYSEPAEMIGRPVLDFVHPDDRPRVMERIARVMEQGKPGELTEERFVRKDGSLVPVEVVNAPFYWQGRPAVQVVVRDITVRRRAEAELRESEERFRRLVESSPEGIAVCQDDTVVLANRACARMLGVEDPAELVGQRASTLVHPDDLPRVEAVDAQVRAAAHEPGTGPLSVRFLRRDGSSVAAEVMGASTTWKGHPAVQIMIRISPAQQHSG